MFHTIRYCVLYVRVRTVEANIILFRRRARPSILPNRAVGIALQSEHVLFSLLILYRLIFFKDPSMTVIIISSHQNIGKDNGPAVRHSHFALRAWYLLNVRYSYPTPDCLISSVPAVCFDHQPKTVPTKVFNKGLRTILSFSLWRQSQHIQSCRILLSGKNDTRI
jgi:hypothetical protein